MIAYIKVEVCGPRVLYYESVVLFTELYLITLIPIPRFVLRGRGQVGGGANFGIVRKPILTFLIAVH